MTVRATFPILCRRLSGCRGAVTPGPNFTTEQLEGITASLVNASNTLVQRNNDIPVNGALDVTAGTAIDIGSDRLGHHRHRRLGQ